MGNRMQKIVLAIALVCCAVFATQTARAQAIPVSMEHTEVYDFIDELITDGYIVHQTAVRPYTRTQIANMLLEASRRCGLQQLPRPVLGEGAGGGESDSTAIPPIKPLNARQRKALNYYLDVFALERDTMVCRYVQYTDHQTFSLSLANPQFSYMSKKKMFKFTLEPILGMDIYGAKKGAILKRWYGAELRMDIARHLSIWGSLRDISWNGTSLLSDNYYANDDAKIDGAKLTKPLFLNNLAGVQYKEAEYGGDFSDSRGGIALYSWWGRIALERENIRWGDSYHCSNILSGRNPAVPMLSLQLTPCAWFQFDYFHAWLISNVLDSTNYYIEHISEGVDRKQYRPHNKFMAANMFTFTPVKYLSFSFGNSIVYAEPNVQALYFIPIAFFKSLDHLMTKGTATQNQNSQAFASISVRPWDHIQLYGSFFLDEFKLSRLKKSSAAKNPVSYLVGFNWSGWPLKGLSLRGEFMRSYIACYTQSVDVLDYTSNTYQMGHYMGDNAQTIHLEVAYRPIRGLRLALSYTNDTKYNAYSYLRRGIIEAISQKPFDKAIYRNDEIAFNGIYEVHPSMYLRLSLLYNNARAFDNLESEVDGEYLATAQEYLNTYAPVYFQGKNFTAQIGFSFGF